MANFWKAWEITLQFEGGYSNSASDLGNYFAGQLLGTKYGITPQTYYNHFKQIPTAEIMKNLSKQQAGEIAKNIWNKYGLEAIPIQGVANNVFDCLFHYSYTTASNLIQDSVLLVDSNLLPKYGNDKAFGTETLNAIISLCNKGKGTIFNNYLVEQRVLFYEARIEQNASQLVFLAGWLRRAGAYVMANIEKSGKVLLLLGAGALAYILFNKK